MEMSLTQRRFKAARAIHSGPTEHAADPCGVVSLLDAIKYNVRFHE